MALLRQLIRKTMAATLPRRMLLVRGPSHTSHVCLTFDDGPHPDHTPRVLDVLKEHSAPATFFVVGQQVQRHPDLVRRIVAEGHLVGHHTYSHSDPQITSASQLLAELDQTNQLLEALLGHRPVFFRPPHGKLTPAKLFRLWRAGQRIILWNSDPKDVQSESSATIRQWFTDHPLKPGDLVLLHDKAEHTSSALPELITSARSRGLEFTTVATWTA
jgi:peptidoglycan/xylan/chitin deacetylase (PgdA/CDA1 family)